MRCSDQRSSHGNTATVRMPSSTAARKARTAISPRLATRTLSNLESAMCQTHLVHGSPPSDGSPRYEPAAASAWPLGSFGIEQYYCRVRRQAQTGAMAPSSTARNACKPASDDDPHGPDDTPSVPSLSDIFAADSSPMLIEASTPLRRYGHAIWDGVPQLRPAILVFPVGTVVS